MVHQEVIYLGVGKAIWNDNILNVFDWKGKLLLEIVIVDEYNPYLKRCD